MFKQLFLVVIFVTFLSSPAFAAIQNSGMMIFAVTTSGEGLPSELHLEIEEGDGKVFSEITSLVGTTTQNAERTAVKLARAYEKSAGNYNYKYSIISEASVVDGPSAGAAMALLAISMLRDKDVPGNVSITGTINDNGVVGPVGGVLEKVRAAREEGIDLFMIPRGSARQTIREGTEIKSINLLEYGPSELGIKVVEVGTIEDVLKFAHSNIETIDVNIDVETAPLFIPKSIPLKKSLLPLKELGKDYIDESDLLVKQARNSLSTTLLEDRDLLNALVQTLSSTENTLEDASIAYDQNYMYSAANFSFLAKVNALFIKEIADNPSIVSKNSTLFRNKVDDLKDDIAELRSKLGNKVPSDYVEWHAAAMQRLSYAEVNIKKVETHLETESEIPDGEIITFAADALFDFEFAVAWYDVAKDFYELGKTSKKKVRADNNFKLYADSAIIEAENTLSQVEGENDDLMRRLLASKIEKNNEWYIGAGMDAISAVSLGEAELFNSNNTDINVLYSELEFRIADAEEKINNSMHKDDFVWSSMYLDAAKYFLNSADFYYERGQSGSAISSLQSGISLVYLALGTYSAAEDYYNYYDTFTEEDYLVEPVNNDITDFEAMIASYLLVLALIVVILTIVLLIVGRTVSGRRYLHHYSIPEEIKNVRRLMRKVDEAHAKGKISEKDFKALSRNYQEELALLVAAREEKTEEMLEITTHEGDIKKIERKIAELKRLRSEELLTEDDFKLKVAEFNQELDLIREHMRKDKLKLTLQKAKIMEFAKREEKLGKEIKKSIKKKKKS